MEGIEMTTVNSRLVNLRHPASDVEYSLHEYVTDCAVVPSEIFESLEDIKTFLIDHRSGIVSFPRRSTYNAWKYPAYLKATTNALGVVTLNVMTSDDHHPLSKNDVRPILGGDWVRGDIVRNVDSFKRFSSTEWICVESGTPGVWYSQGFTKTNYSDLEVVDELPGAKEYNEGRMVLHRVSSQESEICYCARVGDDEYEWKSILKYDVEHPPEEEDVVDKFLVYSFPLDRMAEFKKHNGPDLTSVYDLRDRFITAEDMVEYDRLQYNKIPSYTDESTYLADHIITTSSDLGYMVSDVYYCPYDFSTYAEDHVPIGYPPIRHPIILRATQFKRVVEGEGDEDIVETVVTQKATDVLTGETYTRIGKLDQDEVGSAVIKQNLTELDDETLYDWHQNGNAIPVVDMQELLAIIDKNFPDWMQRPE